MSTFTAVRPELAYVAIRFKPLCQGKVLDVGCDQALLKQPLPSIDYVGVDITGTPDMRR